jgi:EAL domain-containing protein (putative c-di-GMP-specific phosphodiesterase class I)
LIQRPVDVLKIDRSFVSQLPATASVAVVRAIVAMAAALGLRTVAEGVEHEEQLAAVRSFGCDRVQGFLLARPMPLEALLKRYAARAALAPVNQSAGSYSSCRFHHWYGPQFLHPVAGPSARGVCG